MEFALGIDLGTSGLRANAVTADGAVIAEVRVPITTQRRDPGSLATSLEQLFEQLWEVASPLDMIGICVDGTSGSVLGLDADGRPVGALILYNDQIEDPEILAVLQANAPPTSIALGGGTGLARAMALEKHPGVIRVAHEADYVAELISGQPMPSDESNALKTGYDTEARRWPDWMTQLSVFPLLPKVIPTGTIAGHASGRFGIPQGVPIYAGLTDGCASFLAAGGTASGHAVTALGTTLTLKLMSDTPVTSLAHGVYSHRIGDMWLAGGASNTGGGVLAAHFSPDELVALSAQINPTRDMPYAYYPLIKPGERFPVNDPDHMPVFEPALSDPAEKLHAMLDGIARIEADGYRLLADCGASPVTQLRTVGGGAQNDTWTALRARRLKVPLVPAQSVDAAQGTARIVWMALEGRL